MKHANSGKYEIVVLSNRKAESQKKFVLGSVSHKVAKRATIPCTDCKIVSKISKDASK